jgi:hypothetical protein
VKVAENMRSQARSCRYSFLAGISTGYDSPTTCALARTAGLEEAFTFTKARDNYQDDDGSEIGKHLGLKVHQLDRYSWRKRRFPEVPFISATGFASGVEITGAEHLLRNKVLLTGIFGDEIWDVSTPPEQIRNYKRKEISGLELSEYRLRIAAIHVPVPYIGYTGMEDVLRIAKSKEMKQWDFSNTPYEHYSRPICRRILEQSGVPRAAFASEKKASVYGGFEVNLTKATLREIYAFNRAVERRTKLKRIAPSLLDRAYFAIIIGLSAPLLWLGGKKFRGSGRVRHAGLYLRQMRSYEFSFNRAFPWALKRAMTLYDCDVSQVGTMRQEVEIKGVKPSTRCS